MIDEHCVYCGNPAEGRCVDCDAWICLNCDAEVYEDNLLCDDMEACEERIECE